jgi:SAM-dependent methyltransferase
MENIVDNPKESFAITNLRELSSLYAHPSVVLWRFAEILAIRSGLSQTGLQHPMIDIGSGDGRVSLVTFGRNGVDLGIDLSLSITRTARKIRSHQSLIVADASKLPLRSDIIGTVFSNSVLEHIPALDEVLRELRRVLVKGGTLVFTVPNEKFSAFLSLSSFFAIFRLQRLSSAYSNSRNRKLQHFHCMSLVWWSDKLTTLGLKPQSITENMPSKAVMIWDLIALFTYPISYAAKRKRLAPPVRALERMTRGLRLSVITALAPTFLPNDSGGAVLAIFATKIS